jgi:hypothetical protein
MLGKCKFLNKWLEQRQYHAWLRNSPDIHKAHCKCCNKSFDISSMGESALQSRMKGIFISLFLPCVKGGVKTVLGIKKEKKAKCVGIWETKTMGKYLKLCELVKSKKLWE